MNERLSSLLHMRLEKVPDDYEYPLDIVFLGLCSSFLFPRYPVSLHDLGYLQDFSATCHMSVPPESIFLAQIFLLRAKLIISAT